MYIFCHYSILILHLHYVTDKVLPACYLIGGLFDSGEIHRDGPFDIRGGGGWAFLKKIVCFLTGAKKIKCLQQS